jgi:hypothetical protein
MIKESYVSEWDEIRYMKDEQKIFIGSYFTYQKIYKNEVSNKNNIT